LQFLALAPVETAPGGLQPALEFESLAMFLVNHIPAQDEFLFFPGLAAQGRAAAEELQVCANSETISARTTVHG
jgi:hypothetical protein